jgi:hypothetical protein
MKKIIVLFSIVSVFLIAGCSSNNDSKKENTGKIKLVFQPIKGKPVKINYEFAVHSAASGDINFTMVISGKGETAKDGNVTLELKNEHIKLTGNIQGKNINGSADAPDSLSGDAKLVAMPVFTLLGKTYRSIYNGQLDKKSEVQVNEGAIVDSSENKMQILVRYPANEVGIGDSWQKEILIKSGNKMNCSANYTLKELKGDTAVIAIEGKLFGKGESFGNEFSMDGKLNGTFTVDIKTGWPLNSDIKQEFTLKMGEKEIPMKYDIKSKIQ